MKTSKRNTTCVTKSHRGGVRKCVNKALSTLLMLSLFLSFSLGTALFVPGSKTARAASIVGSTTLTIGDTVKDSADIVWRVVIKNSDYMILDTVQCPGTSRYRTGSYSVRDYDSSGLKSTINSWGNSSAGADIRASATTDYNGHLFFAPSRSEVETGYYALEGGRKKGSTDRVASFVRWWLMDCYSASSDLAWFVDTNGSVSWGNDYDYIYFCPACALPITTKFYMDNGVYRIAKKSIITYDGNGGIPSKTSDTVYADAVSNLTYPALPTATRNNYVFTGFFTAPNGGSKVNAGDICSEGSQTVYAHWKPYHSIAFNANGGTFS